MKMLMLVKSSFASDADWETLLDDLELDSEGIIQIEIEVKSVDAHINKEFNCIFTGIINLNSKRQGLSERHF